RVDQQVKVRGYRIELGEVEAAIIEQAGVSEAVVVAREDEAGEQTLAAYLVADLNPAPLISELRRHLRGRLPEYMIPTLFMYVDRLPLTPNGKVDRRALPAMKQAGPGWGKTDVGPRGPIEEALCSIWAEVLGQERIGIYDNFFSLGGHSLLA